MLILELGSLRIRFLAEPQGPKVSPRREAMDIVSTRLTSIH